MDVSQPKQGTVIRDQFPSNSIGFFWRGVGNDGNILHSDEVNPRNLLNYIKFMNKCRKNPPEFVSSRNSTHFNQNFYPLSFTYPIFPIAIFFLDVLPPGGLRKFEN